MMDTLDDLGRRSAGALRMRAEALADTEAALADVLTGVTVTPVRSIGEVRRPRRWLAIAAAAAALGVVATGALVVSRQDADDVVPGDTIPGGWQPYPVPPPLTAADAEVLYETTVGSGPGQLGVEDELRPLAPIVLGDGTLVLGDPVNHRTLFVTPDGGVSEDVYDDNEFVWDSLGGPLGGVMSLVYSWSNQGLVNGRVEASPTGMGQDAVVLADAVGDCCAHLRYDGGFGNENEIDASDDGTIVVREDAGLPQLSVDEGRLDVEWEDGRTFSLTSFDPVGGAQPPDLSNVTAFFDGTLLTISRSDEDTWLIGRSGKAGSGGGYTIDLPGGPADNVGRWSVGTGGIVVLTRDGDTFRVLRFPLPGVELAEDPVEEVEATEVTVLAEFGVGSSPAQLGLEECQGCDPLAPLAPMVAPDGTLVIADTFNRRWVVIAPDGERALVPYPADTFVHDAVMAPDGTMYWVEYVTSDGVATLAGIRSAPHDWWIGLDEPASLVIDAQAVGTQCCRTIRFDGTGEPAVEDPTVTFGDDMQFVVRRGLMQPTIDGVAGDSGPMTLQATYPDGVRRQWTLANPGLGSAVPSSVHALPDGSLVAIQVSPLSQEARILHTINHLRLDGTVATANLPAGVTTVGPGGHWSVTPDGVTTMIYDPADRLFQVVRYPLPGA